MKHAPDTAGASNLAEARGNIYGFLSRLLLEAPTESLVSPLCQPDVLAALGDMLGAAAPRHFQDFLQHYPENLKPLVQEYHDLFTVPLGRYVTPYEAVYRDERVVEGKRMKGLLMGESSVAVQQSYREAEVRITEDFLELPDHAGLELSFMSYLCHKQAEALNRSDTQQSLILLHRQKTFLQKHLTPWIPSLCARICEQAQGPFYKGVAKLIEAFIALEAETLSQTGTD